MRRSAILLLALVVAFGGSLSALAEPEMLDQFTQNEIDENWEPDRQEPSDGATSVDAFGRENALRIGIDSSEVHQANFRRTEGLKTINPTNFGDGVEADLYIDPDWQGKAVRAGLWVVGDNGEGGRDAHFGIIEFVNNEPCPEENCSNQSNITDHTGWRIWGPETSWFNVSADFSYGEWVTLAIELDTSAELYRYYVDGQEVGTSDAGQTFIREVFLNSYNYGADNFPTLSSESYAAHWHAGLLFAVEQARYVLCTSPYSGNLFSTQTGECGSGLIEVETPSLTPHAFCIHNYTGRISYSPSGQCSPAQRLHVVPNDGDLLTCMSIYTGINRWTSSHDLCAGSEVWNLIPVGDLGPA